MTAKRIFCICIAVLLFALAVLPAIVRADSENLSVGKSYTLVYDSPIEHAYPAYTYESEGKLTDGAFAKNMSFSDSAFLELYRGTAVSVTIDLEKVCGVSLVDLRTFQNKAAGIYCARYVKVAVSENGTDFATVGLLEDSKTVTDDAKKIVTHSVHLDKTYLARYVRVTFSCDVYVYTDEITVYGTENTGEAVSATFVESQTERGYSGEIDGIGNIVLMYTVGNYTKETLRPYLAYIDASDGVADTMFDSMLFLPSPVSNYDFSKPEAWNKYISAMFGAEDFTNLTALDSLVGELRHELSMADEYRYPVFLAIPYLKIGNSNFNGVRPDSLENRTKIISSYVDQMVDLFASSDFSNLELKGFYWFHESISYSASEYEEDLMINFNNYVHEKGFKSIWIPYYCSPGFERAVDLGFDSATLQSGYAFARSGETLNLLGDVLPEVVDDSAMQARKYGLGMEFELDINVANAYERFYKYLHSGYSTGCMSGHMMMLYQGVDALYKCANSADGTDHRKIYDLLYLYNKEQFTSQAPTVAEDQIIVSDLNKRTSGTLSITDGDSLKSELDIVDLVATEGLTYVLEGDGFYILNTNDTAPGLYHLTFKVTDGYNLSEQVNVKVFIADFSAPTAVLTLQKEIRLYSNMTQHEEVAVLPADTVVNQYKVENGWFYFTANIGGEEVRGFAEYSDSETVENSDSADASASSIIVWSIFGAVVLGVAVAVIILLIKKTKK